MNKATHYGHCQLCDRQQKLPGAVMAKHGYTTRFHFFEGTCPGSGHQPYEQSCGLLPAQRDWAAQIAKDLYKRAAEERALRDPRAAWMHHYVESSKSKNGRSYRKWIQVELIQEHVVGYRLEGEFHQAAVYGITGFGTKTYLTNCAVELNERKAQQTEALAKQHSEYAAWAQKRIAAWKKSALRPVADDVLEAS